MFERNDETLKAMIAHYGEKNIPNPHQYPKGFEFLVKKYKHYIQHQTKELAPSAND